MVLKLQPLRLASSSVTTSPEPPAPDGTHGALPQIGGEQPAPRLRQILFCFTTEQGFNAGSRSPEGSPAALFGLVSGIWVGWGNL